MSDFRRDGKQAPRWGPGFRFKSSKESGFSIIEVMIVVALIAFTYSVALPNLGIRSESEVAIKLSTLAGDIRNAYDLAVLTGRSYRLVFVMAKGDYWLEEADQDRFFIGADKVDRDPTEAEEKDDQLSYEQKVKEYADLAGQAVVDSNNDKEIPPVSPVVEAKLKLRKAHWTPVSNSEWGKRSLSPQLLIKEMQSEHHGRIQNFSELGENARGMIYFFPNGYVQKAVLYVYYKKDDFVPDESKEPYTVVTFPFEGIAEVNSGRINIDVHEDQKQ